MTLLFITGNKDKLREVQALIPDVQSIDMDLPEIQEIDPHKVIAAKLAEARKYLSSALLVEDTSLSLDGMGGLPGPFAKWFVRSIGVDGLYELAKTFGARATARTIIGYADENNEMHFFEGSLGGLVVPPRGTDGFGWDAIFQPDNSSRTFAEMTPEDKNQCSMRKRAVE
jgi:inosine triphosphate pyrophosphatase